MSTIGNYLITILMIVLFPALIPFILFLMTYWMICSLLKKEEINNDN